MRSRIIVNGHTRTPRAKAGYDLHCASPACRFNPATARTRIETEALPHLRTALELDTIPTVLRTRFSRASDGYLA
jgi:hypothetical protein